MLKLSRILVREQFREPIGIFLALIAPAGFFCFANWSSREALTQGDEFLIRTGWYLAYVALMTALFGFGLYLVGRRESGFIRTFAYAYRARRQFIGAQFMASLMLSVVYGISFLCIAAVVFQVDMEAVSLIATFTRFVIATAVLMIACMTFCAVPLTFQGASNLMSILSMPLIMSGLASTQTTAPALVWINQLNPYFAAGEFIAGTVRFSLMWMIQCVCLLSLGCYGFLHFRINPVWSRY